MNYHRNQVPKQTQSPSPVTEWFKSTSPNFNKAGTSANPQGNLGVQTKLPAAKNQNNK